MKKFTKLALPIAAVGILLVGCSSEEAAESKDEVIVIGTQNDYPPFAFADDSDKLTGFDIEFMRAVDERLDGYTFEFEAATWDSIFLALESNKIQAVVDEVAKTDEREEKYLFSDSYFAAETVIATQAGRTDIESIEDLEGKTVGAVAGDSYTLLLEEYNETAETPINLKYTESGTAAEILQEVQVGRIDAYVNDPIMMTTVIEEKGFDIELVGQPIVQDDMGIVFNKDEQGEKLKGLIDPIIKELKEDGTLSALSEEWTGGDYIPE